MRQVRTRTFGVLLSITVVLAVLAATALYIRLLGERLDFANVVVRTSFLVLLGFLLLLIGRYFILLWFSFLNHVESTVLDLRPHEPLVSIIVPAFNEEVVIDSVVASLAHLDYPRYEIVLVDDGSSDGSYRRALAHARRYREGPVTVRAVTQANSGKAQALNRGIAVAAGDYVVCVDSDSVLTAESLRAALRHFRDPSVGAVAGNVKVANRVNLLTWLQALEYVEGLNMVRSAQSFFRTVNIIPGPLGVFRREAIRGVGGYKSDTFAEDCDLTLALLKRGWKIVYEPRAVTYTEAPECLGQLLRQRYRWTRGILQALRKHRRADGEQKFNLGARVTLAYMMFEAILWPVMNVLANLFFVCVSLAYGFSHLLALWWLQLTLLDAVGALFSVAMEGEDFRLVPLAAIYRVGYMLLIDVVKLLATVEEAAGVPMTWGKLTRVGRLP